MVQRILKVITNNFGLKILAVAIAIVFWLIIVNVEDPEKTKTFTVRVEMQNAEALTEAGLTYEIVDNTDLIAITVRGQRSAIERLSVEDFVATADFENMENMSQVPIAITAKRYANEITITKRSQYVEVFVESVKSVNVPVEVATVGDVSEGYLIADELQASQDTVRLTGPQSLVDSVKRAVAWVDITNLEADAVEQVELVLYDAEDNVVETDRIRLSNSVVTVSVGVLEQNTVPLIYETNGIPADGYRVVEVRGSAKEVSLVGKSSAIDEITSINVGGAALNVSGFTKTTEITVDLNTYLPEGISLAEGQNAEVTVVVVLEEKESREFAVPTENIQINDLPEGYHIEIAGNKIPVTIKDYPAELDAIVEEELKGTIDASGVTEETKELKVTLAGEYQVEGAITVAVEVTKTSEDTTADNGGTENTIFRIGKE